MLIGAAGDSKVGRYLVVGGVGSSTWRRVFPVAYKAKAEKGASILECGAAKATKLDVSVAVGAFCGR